MSASLGVLLAFGSLGLDAGAQTAPAAAQDSGTLRRADADMRRVLEKLARVQWPVAGREAAGGEREDHARAVQGCHA